MGCQASAQSRVRVISESIQVKGVSKINNLQHHLCHFHELLGVSRYGILMLSHMRSKLNQRTLTKQSGFQMMNNFHVFEWLMIKDSHENLELTAQNTKLLK